MYDLSIIIPVYNTEQYLRQCLDSVIAKITDNVEIIMINDGSTDLSPLICDEYALNHVNMKVIHKENEGQSEARNEGIRAAQGRYITFIDSDDYWSKDADILNLLSFMIKHDVDLLFFFFQKYYQKKKQYLRLMPPENEHFIKKDKKQIIELLTKLNPFPASPCTKIVKTELIHDKNLLFPKGVLSEDVEWLFRLIEECDHMCIAYDDFYVYRQQRQDSTTSNVTDKHINDLYCIVESNAIKVQNQINDLIEQRGILSLLAYEYTILMGKILDIRDKTLRRELYLKTKKFKWLLQYDLNPKVKRVRRVESIVGMDITIYLLNLFIRLKSKYVIK